MRIAVLIAVALTACDSVDLCEHAGRCGERDVRCDDGTVPACRMVAPTCDPGSILAHRDHCFVCVNPDTCEPWGVAACDSDRDCGLFEDCDPCGSSSCPACADCVAACR